MSLVQRVIRSILVTALGLGILAGCIGDSDGDPTPTPFIIVATPEADSESGQPTTTIAPTVTIGAAPTLTATQPTDEAAATATAPPSPTPRPTRPPVQPTATQPPAATPTPAPQPIESDIVTIPDDPLTILPTLDDLPAGLALEDEGIVDIDTVAADFEDSDARRDQLEAWGFQGAFFRELALPEDQEVDAESQLIGVITQGVVLGSAENAQLEMNSWIDDFILADAELSAVEISIDPLGDTARAATASPVIEGETFNFALIAMTIGPLSVHIISAGGTQYDPLPDALTAARVVLDRLGYAGIPTVGELLLQTDFSNWVSDDLDSGSLFFGDDGLYHIIVNQGDGSFVSAYSTDHDPFTDVLVSVDMQLISILPDVQGCVQTRVDPENQQYNYALCVNGAGEVEALYEEFDSDGNYANEPLLAPGSMSAAPAEDGWFNLAIATRGEELWFLVNGDVVGSARHAGPASGAAGVVVNYYASDPAIPAEVVFTNLNVWAIE